MYDGLCWSCICYRSCNDGNPAYGSIFLEQAKWCIERRGQRAFLDTHRVFVKHGTRFFILGVVSGFYSVKRQMHIRKPRACRLRAGVVIDHDLRVRGLIVRFSGLKNILGEMVWDLVGHVDDVISQAKIVKFFITVQPLQLELMT